MAGSEELIIKLIILTVILVAIGLGGYYGYKYYQKKCPDGLFACLGLDDTLGPGKPDPTPDEITPTDPTTGPTAATYTKSELYDKCASFLIPDDTRTCMTGTQVGVRWTWSTATQNTQLAACKAATKKWKVIMSSSGDNNHGTKREYTISSPDANSIVIDFGTSAEKFIKNQNIIIRIIPLNDKDEQITPDVTVTVDNKNSDDKTCNAVGGQSVGVTNFTTVQPPSEAKEAPKTNCRGTWKYGDCVSDGNKCGAGSRTTLFVAETPASGGGTPCPTSSSESCYVTENCVAPSDGSPTPTCELDPDYKNVTDVSALKKLITGRFSSLGADVTNVNPIHDFRLTDGTIVKCTKQHRGDLDANGNYTEKPGFYIRNRGMTSIGMAAFNQGSCTYDEATNTQAAVCNNKESDKPCVMGSETMLGVDSVTKYCRENAPGIGSFNVYSQTFTPKRKIVKTQPQGEGAACVGLGETFWEKGILTNTGNSVNCRYTSAGHCGDPESCYFSDPPAPK